MAKVEPKTGPELIARIESRAKKELCPAAAQVVKSIEKYLELTGNESKATEAKIAKSVGELSIAQEHFAEVLNTVGFFASLDEESNFGFRRS